MHCANVGLRFFAGPVKVDDSRSRAIISAEMVSVRSVSLISVVRLLIWWPSFANSCNWVLDYVEEMEQIVWASCDIPMFADSTESATDCIELSVRRCAASWGECITSFECVKSSRVEGSAFEDWQAVSRYMEVRCRAAVSVVGVRGVVLMVFIVSCSGIAIRCSSVRSSRSRLDELSSGGERYVRTLSAIVGIVHWT